MKLISWNVHGLGNPGTFRALCKFISLEDPELVLVMETKSFSYHLEKIRICCRMTGCFGVGRVGLGGGLGLLWKEEVIVSLLSFSVGHIDVNIISFSKKSFHFIGFYGNPKASLRKHSWQLLRRLIGPTEDTWLVYGDFNEITSIDEKLGGAMKNQH